MLLSPKMQRQCLLCFSTLGKRCFKFLGSSLSWKWDQSGKCFNSILTPVWQEPRGRVRNRYVTLLQPSVATGLKTGLHYIFVIICVNTCRRHSQNFGQKQSNTPHLFDLSSFPGGWSLLVLLLVHEFLVFVDVFLLISQIFV